MSDTTASETIERPARPARAPLPPGQLYLTAADIGTLVGVHRKTVKSWSDTGKHGFPKPCRYLGDVAYWRRSDIVAWMEPAE